jgi:YD repeat-containing protein
MHHHRLYPTPIIRVPGGVTTSYCYDAGDKLVSSTDPRYGTIAYDARGNTPPSAPRPSLRRS